MIKFSLKSLFWNNYRFTFTLGASLVTQMVENPPTMQETWVWSLVQEDSPWNRKWQPDPVFLPREFQGQRSLAGYSAWGRRVRHDWAINTHTHHTHTYSLIINNTEISPVPFIRFSQWEYHERLLQNHRQDTDTDIVKIQNIFITGKISQVDFLKLHILPSHPPLLQACPQPLTATNLFSIPII